MKDKNTPAKAQRCCEFTYPVQMQAYFCLFTACNHLNSPY